MKMFFFLGIGFSLLTSAFAFHYNSHFIHHVEGSVFPRNYLSERIKMKTKFLLQPVSMTRTTFSFVDDMLKPYSMKLHSQIPASVSSLQEGGTNSKTAHFDVGMIDTLAPTRQKYLQFLVDSHKVYSTFENILSTSPQLVWFLTSGLERSEAYQDDIEWLLNYDNSLTLPSCGTAGLTYSTFIDKLFHEKENFPKFICHFYNYYFAHISGGRYIGSKLSKTLLDGFVLKSLQWPKDIRVISEDVKMKIDYLAKDWNEKQKKECVDETLIAFQYGASLVSYIA
jgi:hypothetical protein